MTFKISLAEQLRQIRIQDHSAGQLRHMMDIRDEKLKEFKSAGKVALRKFLDDINATDTMMNGRINEDTVLLKVQ